MRTGFGRKVVEVVALMLVEGLQAMPKVLVVLQLVQVVLLAQQRVVMKKLVTLVRARLKLVLKVK